MPYAPAQILAPTAILGLQRTSGNHPVSRLLARRTRSHAARHSRSLQRALLEEDEALQKLGGDDLDKLKKGEGVNAQPDFKIGSFMQQLGKLAAVDFIVGIGDRFKIPSIRL